MTDATWPFRSVGKDVRLSLWRHGFESRKGQMARKSRQMRESAHAVVAQFGRGVSLRCWRLRVRTPPTVEKTRSLRPGRFRIPDCQSGDAGSNPVGTAALSSCAEHNVRCVRYGPLVYVVRTSGFQSGGTGSIPVGVRENDDSRCLFTEMTGSHLLEYPNWQRSQS